MEAGGVDRRGGSDRNGRRAEPVRRCMKIPWIVVPVLAAGLVLGACGQSGSTPPDAPGRSPVTSPTQPDPTQPNPTGAGPTGSGSPLPGGPSADPATPTWPPRGAAPPTGTTTLSGTVRAGVEMNCLLLDGYLLVGGPRDVIRAGARVTVTGQVRGDLMTTCQQGTPFMVQSATPG